MPDSQGFATKDELIQALKGGVYEARVRKIVACAGIVKVWASTELGFDGALAVQKFLATRPGVQSVTVVPDES